MTFRTQPVKITELTLYIYACSSASVVPYLSGRAHAALPACLAERMQCCLSVWQSTCSAACAGASLHGQHSASNLKAYASRCPLLLPHATVFIPGDSG